MAKKFTAKLQAVGPTGAWNGAKANPGDTVKMTLDREDMAKTVEVPPDVKRALAMINRAKAAFDKLAPSHRREHIRDHGSQETRNTPAADRADD